MRRPPLNRTMLIVLCAAAVLLAATGYLSLRKSSPHFPPFTGKSLRVLFVGNSFTSVNDLPKTVADIAASLGDRVEYDSNAPGGFGLAEHAKDATTLGKLRARTWDAVLLQDQSQRPALESMKVDTDTVAPSAQLVMAATQQKNTRVIFYETWGYKKGDRDNCAVIPELCTYDGMQARLNATYERLAAFHHAELAAVGTAWQKVRQSNPRINLYAADGIHPSPAGTYLAACVIYRTLFGKDPVGAFPLLGLDRATANTLQEAASAAH